MDINKNHQKKLSYEWRNGNCSKCTSWMYDLNNKMLHYEPDTYFPVSQFPDELYDGKLKPMTISLINIETGVIKIIHYLEKNEITNNEAKSFMRYLGINAIVQEKIIIMATNNKKHMEENNSNIYEKYKSPSAYYGFSDLSVFVEAPMHLLMLGVMKSVMIKIGSWLRSINQNTNFLSLVKSKLLIIKNMNIEWCKILEYPTTEKTGGWVSENFLAMSRLGVWFYSYLFLLPIKENYKDPIEDYSTWTKQQCVSWLDARSISNIGSASDLRRKIGEYIINNKIPPITLKNNLSVIDIMKLIESTTLMISNIMSLSTKFEDIGKIEAMILIFLYYYDKTEIISKESKIPSWIKQYNMLCLLNIPMIMKNYGYVRNIWEGGKDGEAYLKQVKHNLKAGLVNKWQSWVINNLLKDEVYDGWKSEKNVQHNLRNIVKVYGSYEKVKEVITNRIPISVICSDKKMYICYRYKGSINGIRIKLYNITTMRFNLIYYTLYLTSECIEIGNQTKDYIGVILLPSPKKEKEECDEQLYCYVTSDWSVICHSK